MSAVLCGLWHVHAAGYLNQAREVTDVIGVWDEDPERLKAFAEANNVYAFGSFEELLESKAENAIVCTATTRHKDVMLRLAAAGKNIFTEKVLAATDEDCRIIAEAIRRSGVKFAISLVRKFGGPYRTVKKIMDSGELGKINYLRFHNNHSGSSDDFLPACFYHLKECGGGAMMDLGAHGMYVTDGLLGQPETYKSVFTRACTNERANLKNKDGVEDNAVTVMGYPDGCIAINETGFVTKGSDYCLEVGGERGFVRQEFDGVFLTAECNGYKKQKVELCEDLPTPLQQLLSGNVLPGCGLEEAKRLTHMMVMAYQNR